MNTKLLPVFAAALLVAGCNRQHGPSVQAAGTAPAQAASPATGANPEPVERTVPPPGSPPVSARVADEPPAAAEVVIPASTRIRVRLGESLDTRNGHIGERFSAYLDDPIVVGDRVVVPKGTLFSGHVVQSRRSGRLRGRAYLGVTLDSFRLHGAAYAIATRADVRASGSHKKRNAIAIGGGSGTGAAIGAIAGGGVGALIGAGAGAAAGTTGAFITGRKNVRLPAETPLVFSLRSAVTVRG